MSAAPFFQAAKEYGKMVPNNRMNELEFNFSLILLVPSNATPAFAFHLLIKLSMSASNHTGKLRIPLIRLKPKKGTSNRCRLAISVPLFHLRTPKPVLQLCYFKLISCARA